METKTKSVSHYIALFASLVALASSVVAIVESRRAETRAYEKIVSDCWKELEPVLKDAGVKVDGEQPRTIAELARRLKPIFEPLGGGPH